MALASMRTGGPAARRLAEPRPRRGAPAATRSRLVAAAATEFNRVGYHATDTNRIARAAGYAPATFYKHFDDKRAVLLAAYEAWVDTEWQAIEAALAAPGSPDELARRIVDGVLAFHRRWRGLRASLRALVATDPVVRSFYRRQRRRQLDFLRRLRGHDGGAAERAADAALLYTLERVCDAIAEGEPRDLGVDVAGLEHRLRDQVGDALRGSTRR